MAKSKFERTKPHVNVGTIDDMFGYGFFTRIHDDIDKF